MGMVFVDRLGVPAVCYVVKHHLDDLDVRIVNPWPSLFVQADMKRRFNPWYHARTLPDFGSESRPIATALKRVHDTPTGAPNAFGAGAARQRGRTIRTRALRSAAPCLVAVSRRTPLKHYPHFVLAIY